MQKNGKCAKPLLPPLNESLQPLLEGAIREPIPVQLHRQITRNDAKNFNNTKRRITDSVWWSSNS